MPVTGLNHVNIRTLDIERSAAFYVEVFDLEFRQERLAMGRQSNWLFDRKGNPIIHLRLMEAESSSTGPIDHVALNCEGKTEILRRLEERKIKFSIFENAIPGMTQVFVVDPHGVALELSFAGE